MINQSSWNKLSLEEPKLVWTRSQDAWLSDYQLFISPNTNLMHLPCITITPLKVDWQDQSTDIVIFTSTTAVRLAQKSLSLWSTIKDCQHIYTVGTKTKKICHEHGLIQASHPKDVNNGCELHKWIERKFSSNAKIIHPAAQDLATENPSELRQKGYEINHIPIYKTTSKLSVPSNVIPILNEHLHGVVCFASPSAVKGFFEKLKPQKKIEYVVIGETTANALQRYAEESVTMVDQPSVDKVILRAESILEKMINP